VQTLIVAMCVVLPAGAQENAACFDYREAMAHWVGTVKLPSAGDVVGAGRYAYVADGYRDLNVIDIFDPAGASIVRQIDTGRGASELQKLGGTLFVRTSDDVRIFDLALPTDPALIGIVLPDGRPNGFAVADDLLYLAAYDRDFHVVDVSLPSAPVFLATISTDQRVNQVAVSGDHVYLAGRSLSVVDVSVPLQPNIVADLDLPSDARGLAPADSLLYMAASDAGLVVVRVVDPKDPRIAAIKPVPSAAWDVALQGSGLLVADEEWGILAFDRSDPLDPRLLRSFDTFDHAGAVATTSTLILAADSYAGLQIIDPTKAIATPVVAVSGPQSTNDVKVLDDLAYVADQMSGLVILDVSLPVAPVELGRLDDVAGMGAIAVTDGVACLGGYYLLFTVDVDNPSAPEKLGQSLLRGEVGSIEVREGLAYLTLSDQDDIGDSGDGFSIVDLSSPDSPHQIAFLQLARGGEGLALQGEIAYVADGKGGVYLIDVSDPYAPTELGRFDVGTAYASDVAVEGRYAYVAYDYRGFEVVDVSDPWQPSSVARINTPGKASAVLLRDGVAYLADYDWGLRAIDVRIPERPFDLGVQDSPGEAMRFDLWEDHLYLCTTYDGLVVAERQCDLILTDIESAYTNRTATSRAARTPARTAPSR